ncbi:MAG: LLM class flavin-dependent oxidoreductase [Candidatus Dormibacteraceae bacterium]
MLRVDFSRAATLTEMKVGLALPVRELGGTGARPFRAIVDDAIRAEKLGFDSVWIADHVFIDRDGLRRTGGPDPLTLLTYVAARTERVQLGTLVLCAAFRPPVQLAREARALAEASSGRLLLGVGSGWHQPEFDAFGIPFDHLVGRFSDYLEVLSRLFADGPADFSGPYHSLRGGQVFGSAAPPLWIAAFGPRMLSLTARFGAGWNTAWLGPDTAKFTGQLAALDTALAAAGRSRAEIEISAGLLVLPGPPAGPLPDVITGGPDEIATALRAYRDAGAQHLILSLAAVPFGAFEPALLDAAAEAIARI